MSAMKALLAILKLILNHPFNSGHKIRSIIDFFKWQTASRLMDKKFIINWVNNSKFIVSKGESGLTGNLYFGLMEYEDMSFLLHFTKKTDTFYDIGANVGAYTILASAVRGCHSICFEPLTLTFERLLDQIKVNRIGSLVDARNNGVGDKNEKLEFTSNLDCGNRVNTDPSNKEIEEVDVITLDSNFDPKSPTIVKIDVEGYEKFIIDGGSQFFLNPNVIALIVELSGDFFGVKHSDIDAKITSFGFLPISYSPLTRKINTLDLYNVGGNSIYVKDIDDAKKRCLDSEKFCIHTANGLII